MKIRVERAQITEVKCDLLVVNEFEGVKQPGGATGAVDKALNGLITRLTREGEIDGKLGKVTLLHCNGNLKARKVAVVGLGQREKFDLEAVRTPPSTPLNPPKKH